MIRNPCADEDGGLWRVVVNPADGTLAVEEIEDRIDTKIEDRETVGMTPCGIARWNLDGTLTIFRVNGHGENYTDPKEYQDGNTVWIATPSGWGVPRKSSEIRLRWLATKNSRALLGSSQASHDWKTPADNLCKLCYKTWRLQ